MCSSEASAVRHPPWWFVHIVSLAMLVVVSAALAAFQYPDFFYVKLVFLTTLAFGFLPVVVYGAPVYTILAHEGYARWHYVFLGGIAPGIVLLPFWGVYLGVMAIGCGAAVALLTHLVCRMVYRA